MNLATQSLPQDLPRIERARDELGFFSSESVLNILKLILAGTELPDILAIIARLVESQGDGTLCTIWLPMPMESICIALRRPVFLALLPARAHADRSEGRFLGHGSSSQGAGLCRRHP
jgi:hypothetical protein